MKIKPSDFHNYAFTDYLDNVVRGSLGEYLVASALGVNDTPESSWESWDITYGNIKIEVKTSSYVQTWKQKKLTTPRFGIPKRLGWQAETNEWGNTKERQADIYVFCLFTFKDYIDKESARSAILETRHWEFYVIPTKDLPTQETIGLWGLSQLTEPISFEQLPNAIKSF